MNTDEAFAIIHAGLVHDPGDAAYPTGQLDAAWQYLRDQVRLMEPWFTTWMEAEREKKRKQGAWFLSEEGREMIRETWDDEEADLPLFLLNHIETLEKLVDWVE